MPSEDYKPTADGLAKILPARAIDDHNNRLGAFTADTTPTLAEVEDYIERALHTVGARIGADIPTAFIPAARGVVELRAAMWVELGGFAANTDPEDESGYERFKEMYKEELEALLLALRSGSESEAAVSGIVSIHTPSALRLQADADGGSGW